MSDQTPNLSLPFILPSQAQKHVTHNEAIERLDNLVQLSVTTAALVMPPATPGAHQRFIVGATATGDWAGQDGSVAIHTAGGWLFERPRTGWVAYVEDEAKLRVWNGTEWAEVVSQAAAAEPTPVERLDKLGVNADADDTNKLAVSAAATLLSHAGSGHQVKVNKAGISDTASLLFQTNWSGRAEMGLAGDDRFAIKVSADGSNFTTAAAADPTTGQLELPQGAQIDGAVTGSAVHDGGFGTGTGLLKVGSFGVGAGASQAAQPVASAVRSGVYAAAGTDSDFAPGGDGVLIAAAGLGRVAQLGINADGAALRQSADGGSTWSDWGKLGGSDGPVLEAIPGGTVLTFANGFRMARYEIDVVSTAAVGGTGFATATKLLNIRPDFQGSPMLHCTIKGQHGFVSATQMGGTFYRLHASVFGGTTNMNITVQVLATGMAAT